MIDLYYWPTPNGWKVGIMLEECGLQYNLKPVDIGAGDQFTPEFLAISPNNRMPAIVDHHPKDGGEPISVFESGAILEYLAVKEGKFLPTDLRARTQVCQWVHWQMANLGPMMGNANHFKMYAPKIVDDLTLIEYGVKRFTGEVDRLAGIMDAQLSVNEYLAGSELTIADMATWPWGRLTDRLLGEDAWDSFPNVKRWVDLLQARPGFDKGYHLGEELAQKNFTPEEAEQRRQLLFNQTNESVRAARMQAAKAAS